MTELSWLALSVLAAGVVPNSTASADAPASPPQIPDPLCTLCLSNAEASENAVAPPDEKAIAATLAFQTPEFSQRSPDLSTSFLKGQPKPVLLNAGTVAEILSPASKATKKPAPSVETAYLPEFSLPEPAIPHLPGPTSGSQMYQQRLAALRAGMTYTRLPRNSFWESWASATRQPTYEQWVNLLRWEAQSMARGQGNNRLSVILGDSISQWMPPENLDSSRFWLNQGISGDTTAGVLRRLPAFANTRPDTIHLMIGINDLRRGATDAEVVNNIYEIVQRLRRMHPQAQIVLYSILPTRLPALSSTRIQGINRVIGAIAQHTNSRYFDLNTPFSDSQGILRRELTTDGLHLSNQGYAAWRQALGAVI